jgi:hypothetical protein
MAVHLTVAIIKKQRINRKRTSQKIIDMLAATAVAIGGMGMPGLNAQAKTFSERQRDEKVMQNIRAKAINDILAKYIPEFERSKCAHYPMKYDRWYDPSETAPSGDPCFIPKSAAPEKSAKKDNKDGSTKMPIKENYVFCKSGPLGEGYYSVLCQYTYEYLDERLQTMVPQEQPNCFWSCCRAKSRHAWKEWELCGQVVRNRRYSSVPDDRVAAEERHQKSPTEMDVVNQNVPTSNNTFDWNRAGASIQNATNIRAAI